MRTTTSTFGKERTKYSFYNALSALCLMLVNGLLTIVVTKLVIAKFGSDFNGLNSTANQIINVLLVMEGGFTLASNVALFSPISHGDYVVANSVISATKNKFKKIGVWFLLIGIVVSFVYSYLVNSSLSKELAFFVILMAVFPQAVNLLYTSTYRVILQTQQKEYIINCFTALTIGLGHLTNIIVILCNGQMWMIRFVTMVYALLNCFIISYYVKKKNKFINFTISPRPELIKGTTDVMVQKVTGVIYNSWPIVFLSVLSNGGTLAASVYSVYNGIFILAKGLLRSVIDAPRFGFGQMLTEMNHEDIWRIFKRYEFIVVAFIFVSITTVYSLILPFVTIYTKDIIDINYKDLKIALLMSIIGTIELLHIPSGHIINMSGNFKTSKNIQVVGCISLMVSMAILGSLQGLYGMLYSLLIVSLLLAVLEIGFVHKYFFKNHIIDFIKLFLPFLLSGIVVSYFEMRFIVAETYTELIWKGFLLWGINILIALVIAFLSNKKEFQDMREYSFLLMKKRGL